MMKQHQRVICQHNEQLHELCQELKVHLLQSSAHALKLAEREQAALDLSPSAALCECGSSLSRAMQDRVTHMLVQVGNVLDLRDIKLVRFEKTVGVFDIIDVVATMHSIF